MKTFNVIDEIIPEPLGGAHRNPDLVYDNLRKAIRKHLHELSKFNGEELKKKRTEKFLEISRNLDVKTNKSYHIICMFKQKKALYVLRIRLF